MDIIKALEERLKAYDAAGFNRPAAQLDYSLMKAALAELRGAR